jgi:hypothetical protein
MKEKIEKFAKLVEDQQIARLRDQNFNVELHRPNFTVRVVPGRKFAKVDIGKSGRYMVEMSTGNIFGIKGYGQVHKGHFYGTVETVSDWFWGDYYPIRKTNPLPLQWNGAPVITHAP